MNDISRALPTRRYSTGVPGLDPLLGGGLLPGTLTVVVGSTGIGKTQLGVQFANAGKTDEGRRGVFFDLSCRGDSQSHRDYAQRMFDWTLAESSSESTARLDGFFSPERAPGDYLHVFDYRGRRPQQSQWNFDAWQAWQAELVAKLQASIAFLYGNFVRGVRRVVLDGVDPVDRQADSIQFELFEYVYQQILRKEHDWVARDLFRQLYRENAEAVGRHAYPRDELASLLLYTAHVSMLDVLISKRLEDSDWLAAANTVICLGKVHEGKRLGRALYVVKHRGSYATDDLVPYTIDDGGLRVG